MGHIAEFTLKLINGTIIKIFEKDLLVLFLNTICNLQQLRMFFNNFLSFVLVCKEIEQRSRLGQQASFQLLE